MQAPHTTRPRPRAAGPKRPARPAETFDDLLWPVIEAGDLTRWCRKSGLSPWTILRIRKGAGTRTHARTVRVLAGLLGVDSRRVEAAIAASRAAKN